VNRDKSSSRDGSKTPMSHPMDGPWAGRSGVRRKTKRPADASKILPPLTSPEIFRAIRPGCGVHATWAVSAARPLARPLCTPRCPLSMGPASNSRNVVFPRTRVRPKREEERSDPRRGLFVMGRSTPPALRITCDRRAWSDSPSTRPLLDPKLGCQEFLDSTPTAHAKPG